MHSKDINQKELPVDLLRDIDVGQKKMVLSNRRKILVFIAIILLILLNIYLAHLPVLKYLQRSGKDKYVELTGAYAATLVVLPTAAFFLSLIISFIPYNKIKYTKKYFPFALIILLILQTLLGIALLIPRI